MAPQSSLGLKYPSLRDHPLKTSSIWLEAKKEGDGAESLWRIHDKIYDLEQFIPYHPGGRDWFRLTKGTDITEVFESQHIFMDKVLPILPKYYVKEAASPRYYPFTFYKDDFYRTLKGRIANEFDKIPSYVKIRSKLYTDLLFLCYIVTAVLAVKWGYLVGVISGLFLSLTANATHNFFHQRDNLRMHYLDFTFLSLRDWRVSHVLSHHPYTNTIQDMELSSVEPWLQYLPHEKGFVFRYMSWLYSPIFYSIIFIGFFVQRVIEIVLYKKPVELTIFLPFTVPVLMILITGKISASLIMFAWIITSASFIFGVIGVNAAHHHPDIFHDGDATRSKDDMDWGLFQLDSVMDRKDVTGSPFLVLINFGDHALHHLFPTLDHGALEYLYPIFLKTCKDFGVDWKLLSQIELVKGQFLQLARVKGTETPPPRSRKTATGQ